MTDQEHRPRACRIVHVDRTSGQQRIVLARSGCARVIEDLANLVRQGLRVEGLLKKRDAWFERVGPDVARHVQDAQPRSLHREATGQDRKSTRLNSSHITISYAVFCLKKQTQAALL